MTAAMIAGSLAKEQGKPATNGVVSAAWSQRAAALGETWDRNPQAPDLVLAQVFRFARWQGNQEMLVMFDCAKDVRAYHDLPPRRSPHDARAGRGRGAVG